VDVATRQADEGLNFVFSKIVDSNVGDVSDAGMVYYILTGDEDTDPNKLRTFLNAGQGQTPPVPPAEVSTAQTRRVQEHPILVHVPQRIGMRTWRDCVRKCISTYGDKCFYVQFDRQTAGDLSSAGRAETGQYVQRWPMSTSPDWIITVSIANGRSISSSKNGTMGWKLVATCSDGHDRMPLMMAMTAVTPIMTAHATPQSR
jgi:hypothetical protein